MDAPSSLPTTTDPSPRTTTDPSIPDESARSDGPALTMVTETTSIPATGAPEGEATRGETTSEAQTQAQAEAQTQAQEEERQRQRSNMIASWVSAMDQLLDTLHSSYSDDASSENYDAVVGPLIAAKRNDFKSLVLPIEAIQERAVRAWHDAMKPFYELCRQKKAEPIMAEKCWVLEEIQFSHIWRDPRLNDESKEVLWSYVNGLNTYANMYCTLPAALQSKIESISERCAAAGFDGDISKLGMREILAMSTQAWQGLDANDVRDFTSNLPQLFDAVGGEGGIKHMLSEMGVPQFASVFDQAVSYSQSVMRGETPSVDVGAMLSSVVQGFSQMNAGSEGADGGGEGEGADGEGEGGVAERKG